MVDINAFIKEHVINRQKSMFEEDIKQNKKEIKNVLQDRCILVIGGAGSIGAAFIKEVIKIKLAELIVVDSNENALAELTRDLRSSPNLSNLVPKTYLTYAVDYNSDVFKKIYKNHKRKSGRLGFDIVANFAAHKHVRSEKDVYSVEAMFRNNVFNVKRLLDLLEDNPPDYYFCVSTDKAANPANLMGASKKIMEELVFSYSGSFDVKTARFANVAFSNGSLPASFIDRIRQKQPISAPYDVKRYFVSPQEAGQICLLSTVLGENRDIFFPKLNKAQTMTFDKIAKELIETMGYEVDYCASDDEARKKAARWSEGKAYPVYFSLSDTSGEKQCEEFYTEDEIVDITRFCSLGVIVEKSIPNKKNVERFICELEEMFDDENVTKKDIVEVIKKHIPNFMHIEKNKDLDSKM